MCVRPAAFTSTSHCWNLWFQLTPCEMPGEHTSVWENKWPFMVTSLLSVANHRSMAGVGMCWPLHCWATWRWLTSRLSALDEVFLSCMWKKIKVILKRLILFQVYIRLTHIGYNQVCKTVHDSNTEALRSCIFTFGCRCCALTSASVHLSGSYW